MSYCQSDYCPGCNSTRCYCNELDRQAEEERDLDLESLEETCQREIYMPEEEEEEIKPVVKIELRSAV